jgi:hypothetical protein
MHMRKQFAAAILSLAALQCAHAGEQDAYSGIAADAATTGLALSAPGLAEANPMGWATVPLRLMMVQYAKSLPREQGQPIMDATAAVGWAAAANNLLALAGASVAGPLVAVAVGYSMWKKGEPEREFWAICAEQRKIHPNLKCNYQPVQVAALPQVPAIIGEAGVQDAPQAAVAALPAGLTVAQAQAAAMAGAH